MKPSCRHLYRLPLAINRRALSSSTASRSPKFEAKITNRAKGIGDSVFAAFSQLAIKHNAVNLGQGFPTFPCPDFLKEATCRAINSDNNQYGRPGGNPQFVSVLSEMYSPKFNRNIDGLNEIVTYAGAQEGIACAAFAFIEKGDEVVLIEPYFDAYLNSVTLAGGVVKSVPLRQENENEPLTSSSQLKLNIKELESVITEKTKMIVVNTPHNPIGKVFTLDELEEIADVVRRYPNLIVLSDEVYEYSVFDDNVHHRFANIEGMWERTISIYSVGKTFSVTGWRLGYTFAPPELSKHLLKIRAALSFASVTPFEIGAAYAFKECLTNSYYQDFKNTMEQKRDFLVDAMNNANIPAIVPEGGYFTMGDTGKALLSAVPLENDDIDPEKVLLDRRDFRVARWLTEEGKVTGIPASCFYSKPNRHLANKVLRFCHAKNDATMVQAKQNFESLKNII